MSSGLPAAEWMEPGREAGLVLSAQQGDLESYWELMHHYQPRVFAIAFAILRDRDLAARLAQDALVEGWEDLRDLPVGRPLLPWLLRALRKPLISSRRVEIVPGADAPESSRARALGAAFAEMGVEEQLILALGVVEGLHAEAIGTVMAIQPGAAASRLATARGRLYTRFIAHANAHR